MKINNEVQGSSIHASPARMPDDPTVVGDPDGSPFDEAFIALLRGGDQ